jgi:hypothetical protein
MGTHETVIDPAAPAQVVEVILIEVEQEGRVEPSGLESDARLDPLAHVRDHLELAAEIFLFERDQDEPLIACDPGRRALRLVAHRHKQLLVKVRYEHLTKEHVFAPSKTVFKVLQWAISKHGFNLDPVAAAKANLILPGADAPLPRDSAIGVFTTPGEHVLVLDLTLRDFTNG